MCIHWFRLYNYITIHSANNIKNCILTAANLPQFIKKANILPVYFAPTHELSEGNYDHHQAVKQITKTNNKYITLHFTNSLSQS
jgi:hypothetical protein